MKSKTTTKPVKTEKLEFPDYVKHVANNIVMPNKSIIRQFMQSVVDNEEIAEPRWLRMYRIAEDIAKRLQNEEIYFQKFNFDTLKKFKYKPKEEHSNRYNVVSTEYAKYCLVKLDEADIQKDEFTLDFALYTAGMHLYNYITTAEKL